MSHSRGFTLFEFILVVVVLSFLAGASTLYYSKTMDKARSTRVDILANRFTTGISLVRGQWLVESSMQEKGVPKTWRVNVEGTPIFMNQHGWPTNTDGFNPDDGNQTADECYQVWNTVLQNPPTADLVGENYKNGSPEDMVAENYYRISSIDRHICRYELQTQLEDDYYFEYNLTTGQVKTTAPGLN